MSYDHITRNCSSQNRGSPKTPTSTFSSNFVIDDDVFFDDLKQIFMLKVVECFLILSCDSLAFWVLCTNVQYYCIVFIYLVKNLTY